jgi:hypothetical protein
VRITTDARPSWWRRIGWFVALWLAGVVTITVVAGALRWALHP